MMPNIRNFRRIFDMLLKLAKFNKNMYNLIERRTKNGKKYNITKLRALYIKFNNINIKKL